MTHWNPMATAPRDSTILDLRHVSRAGEIIFRARWLAPCKCWVDWDRQHVTLDKAPLKGWRVSDLQLRAWTPEEEAILAQIHGPDGDRYLNPADFFSGAHPERRSEHLPNQAAAPLPSGRYGAP